MIKKPIIIYVYLNIKTPHKNLNTTEKKIIKENKKLNNQKKKPTNNTTVELKIIINYKIQNKITKC